MDENNIRGGSVAVSFDDPWAGPSKIVLGIDIGLTHSAVAFTFLYPGGKQDVRRVRYWPGLESQQNDDKIPTVLWYDADDKAVSFGAEALTHQAEEDAEDGNWHKTRHFPLHLYPPHVARPHGVHLEPLPPGVSPIQVYSDFLAYLLRHTQAYFEDRVIDGLRVWRQYKATMDVVIAHPNGWSTREQSALRSAAVRTGFISANDAPERVHFITETEASVHFSIQHSNIGTHLQPGTNFVICDAGSWTVDTTVYKVNGLNPVRAEQSRASHCVQAGGKYVDMEAEKYLPSMFQNAGLVAEEIEEYTNRGMQDFKSNAKRAFRTAAVDQTIKVAGTRYNNTAIRAKRGRMTLSGSKVMAFFEPCVNQILASVSSQLDSASARHILLIGKFGESPYLRSQFKARFEATGCGVNVTCDSTSKADGAVIWYCTRNLTSYSYGVEALIPNIPENPAHQKRRKVTWPTGVYCTGGWSQIIPREPPIGPNSVGRKPYHREYSTSNPKLDEFREGVWCYTLGDTPAWMRHESGTIVPGFEPFCTIIATLSDLRGALRLQPRSNGEQYWSLSFNLAIHFGQTEWRAYLEWVENGITRTSPAQLVYFSGPASYFGQVAV